MTFGQSMNDIRTLQNDSMTKYELHYYEAPLGHSNKVMVGPDESTVLWRQINFNVVSVILYCNFI